MAGRELRNTSSQDRMLMLEPWSAIVVVQPGAAVRLELGRGLWEFITTEDAWQCFGPPESTVRVFCDERCIFEGAPRELAEAA